MRKVKFRAYKKINTPEMFTDVVAIDWSNNLIKIKYPTGNSFRIDEESLDNVILLQHTRLKDKNGVEIYEGDIVRHSLFASDISIVRFGEFGVPNMEEMGYQDNAVGFYYENASDLKDVVPFNMTIPLNNEYTSRDEVIGNIYENSEILQTKKD